MGKMLCVVDFTQEHEGPASYVGTRTFTKLARNIRNQDTVARVDRNDLPSLNFDFFSGFVVHDAANRAARSFGNVSSVTQNVMLSHTSEQSTSLPLKGHAMP